jgi:hypothetical protein
MNLNAILIVFLAGCAGNQPAERPLSGLSLLSDVVKQEIHKVEKSIVGLDTEIHYEVQRFDYANEDGHLIPDSDSPLRYKLKPGKNSIIVESDSRTLKGGGLIIDADMATRQYAILTSNHLVSPADTINFFFKDDKGRATDVLFARHVLRSVTIAVRGQSNWLVRGRLIVNDKPNDIAVIHVATDNAMGVEFSNPIGYGLDLGWGDWVFMFGYPNGIKQMSGGWVSKSPYPGTLTIDAAVRFGFSGGPVFALTDRQRLAYVGMIKSAPRRTLDYIAPNEEMPTGYLLNAEDFANLKVKRENLVEFGTAYFVAPRTVKRFLRKYRDKLSGEGILLNPKYYDD